MSIYPKPGLVIRYDFLWKEEELAGLEHGRKDRPCAIILATKPREDGSKEILLCPITHAPPAKGEIAVQIPAKVSQHLHLDDEQSWIKTDQVNTARWEEGRIPYGVTPARKGEMVFGFLPFDLGKKAFEQVREKARSKNLRNVRRDD